MSTLFNSDPGSDGFRLDYMEVFNWGTFHQQVFRVQPNGKTSLLTGANASGKTTLLDALLTLLVPSNKRFYNQSSGAESKKERDELSYFWGYHGKVFSELEDNSKIEKLRRKEDNPYSVLLACFHNPASLHNITLVQVRWYTAGGLKKVFIVSPHVLNIKDHFGEGKFDTRGDWKKNLLKQFARTDIFETFKDYAARFSELFGLKDQALPLFNQTVGIKVLGDLTQFIRGQMLDQPDVEAQFVQLYDHYNDLLISHQAIQKDEKQLELLKPVVDSKTVLQDLNTAMAEFERTDLLAAPFLDDLEAKILEMNARELEDSMELTKAEQKKVDELIGKAEDQQKMLITQKASLDIDNRIQLINKDIAAEEKSRDEKQEKHRDYLNFAKTLGLQTDLTARSFKENYDYVKLMEEDWKSEAEAMGMKRFEYNLEKDKLEKACVELQSNIESLLSRKDRMPQNLIMARNKIAQLLEVSEDTFPFAGELIRVKEDSLHWEDSIERVMNGFAMQLLVPQRFHKQVNAYVHANNMRALLVYERVEDKPGTTIKRWPQEKESLLNKLDIKANGIYLQWIEYQLVTRYDYYCTDDLDVFYGSPQAITSNGLMRNGSKHRKDDRVNRWNKLSYLLGWDNTGTVRLLMEEKKKAEQTISDLRKQIQTIKANQESIESKKTIATLLLSIHSFHEIDFATHAAMINKLQKDMKQLIDSSDKYTTISEQLEKCEAQLTGLRKNQSDLITKFSGLDTKYNLQSQRSLELQLEDLTDEDKILITEFIKRQLQTEILSRTLEELKILRKRVQEALKIAGNETRRKLNKAREEVISLMATFCSPPPAINAEFPDWAGDILNLKADISNLNDFEELYNNIKLQRLVEHKQKFRDYMDNSMLDSLTNFRSWLDIEEDKIKQMIEDLNQPLKKITFAKNPDTYLQLECRPTRDVEMKAFKSNLSETIPDILTFSAQKNQAYRDMVFLRIKQLIDKLKNEEIWRRKVTDVRNRLIFGAREYTIAENKAGQYHEDTASYSGGQKAQFTYAILGAAIAYQFGIFQQGNQSRSLRFIAVDEAFSKLDPQKSDFLMQYCDQLHLQLLVVTPLDKINIAEPYIHAVHFVEIKNKMHSNVYNLTMDEYFARKKTFENLEHGQE